MLDEAIKNGHVIKAKLIKKHDIKEHNQFGHVYTCKKMGTYKYSYNGKTLSNSKKAEFGGNLWNTAKIIGLGHFFL